MHQSFKGKRFYDTHACFWVYCLLRIVAINNVREWQSLMGAILEHQSWILGFLLLDYVMYGSGHQICTANVLPFRKGDQKIKLNQKPLKFAEILGRSCIVEDLLGPDLFSTILWWNIKASTFLGIKKNRV